MQGGFSEGRCWDENGKGWDRITDMAEPPAVADLLDSGAPCLVEWCERMPAPVDGADLQSSILPKVASRKHYQKMVRKRKKAVRTVFVAEEWRDELGRSMLIFVGGPPAPRVPNRFYQSCRAFPLSRGREPFRWR
jgi:hypothetical protein